MNEIDFRNWMVAKGIPKKVQGDYISRIKRLERSIQIDLDEQYVSDRCESILPIFANKGLNPEMRKFQQNDLPIGQYHLSTYKLAVKKYIQFSEFIFEERQ